MLDQISSAPSQPGVRVLSTAVLAPTEHARLGRGPYAGAVLGQVDVAPADPQLADALAGTLRGSRKVWLGGGATCVHHR